MQKPTDHHRLLFRMLELAVDQLALQLWPSHQDDVRHPQQSQRYVGEMRRKCVVRCVIGALLFQGFMGFEVANIRNYLGALTSSAVKRA